MAFNEQNLVQNANRSGGTISIEGMEEVIASLKKIENDFTKRRRLLSILRAQSKPYLKALQKTAPRSERRGRSHSQLNYTSKHNQSTSLNYTGAGNLRRSMKAFPNRNNPQGYVAIHVGPQAKKPRGSGFYGYFLLPGASERIKKETDWKQDALRIVEPQVISKMNNSMHGYLKRTAKKYGWNVN